MWLLINKGKNRKRDSLKLFKPKLKKKQSILILISDICIISLDFFL